MDLIGKTFHELTVLARAENYRPSKGQNQRQWMCVCTCGGSAVVRTGHLTSGAVKSCGCKRHEVTHGYSRSGLYRLWLSMKQRCGNPNHPEYKNYGGRGIAVCQRWQDFAAFLQDVGARPTPDHELDRVDNDSGYAPDNVRWATRAEQCANTRRTRHVEVSPGRFLPRAVAARTFGVPEGTLRYRLRSGWDTYTALHAPPGYHYAKSGPIQTNTLACKV